MDNANIALIVLGCITFVYDIVLLCFLLIGRRKK